MTNTIKASEVRPGMEVQWTHLGITRRCTATAVDAGSPRDGVNLRTSEGGAVYIPGDVGVTVLADPQPEEPTEFGARVIVDERRFIRVDNDLAPWRELDRSWWLLDWDDVCAAGVVTVVEADPSWTAPADREPTPEVPDRIEEWPEDDAHLREQRWRDRKGAVWSSRDGQWGYHSFTRGWVGLVGNRYPFDGPWVRVP